MFLTLVAGLVLLGVLVFVHELGHFVVAKLCGVKVLVFSLGFGPRIAGFRRGDTDYRISALPLGGYVRMFGDDITQPVAEEDKHMAFLEQPTLQKSAIAFAGPAFNFIFPVILIFGFNLGEEQVNSTLIGTVLPDGPAAKAGLTAGDRIVKVGAQPVTYFDELQAEIHARPSEPVTLVVERDGAPREVQMTTGAARSFSPLDRGSVYGRIGVMPGVQRAMVWVAEGSPAHAAGLRSGDVLLEARGEAVETAAVFRAKERSFTGEGILSVVVERAAEKNEDGVRGEPARLSFEIGPAALAPQEPTVARSGVTGDELAGVQSLTVGTLAEVGREDRASQERRGMSLHAGTIGKILDESVAARLKVEIGDRVVAIDGAPIHLGAQMSQMLLEEPDAIHVVGLLTKSGRARLLTVRLESERERGRELLKTLGAIPTGAGFKSGEILTRDVGVWTALERGATQTWELVDASVMGFWMLLSGQVSARSLGGPILIVGIAGDAARAGIGVFAKAMAFISVNLAIVNLLPIPVLDGGHLLIFGIEAIQRRRIQDKTRERVTIAGLVFLVAVLLFAIVNDVLGAVGV